jgi:hypothetical protein
MHISRRSFLGGTSALLAGCATGHRSVSSTRAAVLPQPQLARVHVSADRVIRTITGLRPFRPSGFVVRGEKRGEKTIIHNYGHGGAGLTLSWGTAQLAVEEGAKSEARDCAVLGCGVVGLSTARLLQLRGYNPSIYAKEMPPPLEIVMPISALKLQKRHRDFEAVERSAKPSPHRRRNLNLLAPHYGAGVVLLQQIVDLGDLLLHEVVHFAHVF